MKRLPKHTVDNSIYETLEDSWWAGNGVLSLLKASVNPWRVPFFQQVIEEQLSNHVDLLDIGCGGGVLAEELDRIGCRVTGIDLSEKSLQAANRHAAETGSEIHYLGGSALQLPFPDESFDAAVCGDVLEHLPDWPAVIREVSRILKPGGVFLFDTINRTLSSYLTLILGAQLIPFTRIFPPKTHRWGMFITPAEIIYEFIKNQLLPGELVGGKSPSSPLMLLASVFLLKTGQISFTSFGKKIMLQPGDNLATNYMGFARKLSVQDLLRAR